MLDSPLSLYISRCAELETLICQQENIHVIYWNTSHLFIVPKQKPKPL